MTDQVLIVLLGFFFIGFIFYRKDKYKDHDTFFLSEKDSGLFSSTLSIGLMTFVAQENHQRIKSAKTDSIACVACILAGLIILLFAITIKAISTSIGGGETNPILSVIPALSAPTKLLVSTGILAAAISTSDSALNISAYSCARMFNNNPTKQLIYFSTVFSIIIAMLVAHFIPSIKTIILICINIYIGIILPITAASIFNNTKWTILVILGASSLSVAASYLLNFAAPGLSGFLSGIFTLLVAKMLSAQSNGT